MILNFIFSNLNAIVLILRILLVVLITIRYYRPLWVKDISFAKIALIVASFNIFIGAFITWGQYHVWKLSDATGTYIKMPYFAHYAWTNFWMSIAISFALSILLFVLFKAYSRYRGGFMEKGAELLLALMLTVSYPGILVLMMVGFAFAVLNSVYSHLRGNKFIHIESSFIWTAYIAILFAHVII